MKRALLFLALSLSLLTGPAHADQTANLTLSYTQIGGSPLTILGPDGTTPLAGSTSSDQFVIQFGYYTGATSTNLFAGTWVPLYGAGAPNTLLSNAAMGVGVTTTSGTDDRFNLSGVVDISTPNTSTGIPSQGQIMAMRYYNADSLGAASFFGAASDLDWTWNSPEAAPGVATDSFNLGQTGLSYQGGVSAAGTNIAYSAVPEPTDLRQVLGAVAVGALVLRRRRAKARTA